MMYKRELHLAKIRLEPSHSMTNVIIHNKENQGTLHVSVPLIDHEAAVGTLGESLCHLSPFSLPQWRSGGHSKGPQNCCSFICPTVS